MNKNELVNSVAERANLSRSNAADVVNAVIEAIAAALGTGEEVRLVGFGTFAVVSRAASEGRNPRTGEKIKLAASRQPKFRPSKDLRVAIAGDPTIKNY